MKTWKSDVVSWKMKGAVYISAPFTWNVKTAIYLANQEKKKKVFLGGPGIILMREYVEERLNSNAKILESIEGIEPVTLHNPFATFTTRGCISKCPFCAVPRIEGEFREIEDFVPRPLVCDNNFLAASTKHFNKAIDKLKKLPVVDFNQGLDCTLFKQDKVDRLQELKIIPLRFAFDHINKESAVVDAIRLAKKNGFSQIVVLMLIGFNHTVEESIYMGEVLRREKVLLYPMRYHPLDSLIRNNHVNEKKGWTDELLKQFQRCYQKTQVPFAEFRKNNRHVITENKRTLFGRI